MELNSVAPSSKSHRRPNFSKEECAALVSGVAQHNEALFGKFSNELTNDRKNHLWQEVLSLVNAVSGANPPRNLAEIKKEYQVLKEEVKKLESSNRISAEKPKFANLTRWESKFYH